MKHNKYALIIKRVFLIFLVTFLIIFATLVFSSTNLNELSGSSLLYLFGRLVGLIGFLFLSILIIFGDTARFFDRFFGMDTIIKFQRKFALITSLFVLSHPILFILSDSFYLKYLTPNFASVSMALGTLGLYIFILTGISSILYKRISYTVWQYIHIGTYLLFFFGIYHAFKIGSDTDNLFVKSSLYALSLGIIIGIIYRTNYKLKQRKNKFTVKGVKWETKDTFTLALNSNNKFVFEAGQFCFLRLNKDKLYARHPFTISSSPNEKNITFTIKLQGRFTKTASKLREGEKVILEGPFGTFTIEDKSKPLVFIAGGVGITPFMSIIRDQLIKKNHQQITLIYCSKSKNHKIFKQEIDCINESWFKKIYILSKDEKYLDTDERGYVSKEIIEKYVKNISNSLFYICGPKGLKQTAINALKKLGVNKQKIIIEDFFW